MTTYSKITIRQAKLDDMTFIKDCLVDSWGEHADNEPQLLSKKKLVSFESENYYIDSIKNKKNYILIAEEDGDKCGLIVAIKQKMGYFFQHEYALYIDDVYIKKTHRRKGIAKQLFQKIEEIAKKNNISRIDSRVYTYNHPMQKLLSSMSYSSPYATWTKII